MQTGWVELRVASLNGDSRICSEESKFSHATTLLHTLIHQHSAAHLELGTSIEAPFASNNTCSSVYSSGELWLCLFSIMIILLLQVLVGPSFRTAEAGPATLGPRAGLASSSMLSIPCQSVFLLEFQYARGNMFGLVSSGYYYDFF